MLCIKKDILKHGGQVVQLSGSALAQRDLVEEKYRGMSLAQIIRAQNAEKRRKQAKAERRERLRRKAEKLTAYNEERRRRGEI